MLERECSDNGRGKKIRILGMREGEVTSLIWLMTVTTCTVKGKEEEWRGIAGRTQDRGKESEEVYQEGHRRKVRRRSEGVQQEGHRRGEGRCVVWGGLERWIGKECEKIRNHLSSAQHVYLLVSMTVQSLYYSAVAPRICSCNLLFPHVFEYREINQNL